MQSIHKVAIKNLELPKRWVVWAIVKDEHCSEERVWLRTVADNSNALPLRQKSLLVKKFFEALIGKEIEFFEKCEDVFQACYSVDEDTLPELFQQIDSFSDIYSWFKKNQPKYLENDLKVLREEQALKMMATKRKNTAILQERRKNALKLAFVKGRNPKHGNEQWEARHNGRLYILRREDRYEPSQRKIPIEEIFHLTADRVVLVKRI